MMVSSAFKLHSHSYQRETIKNQCQHFWNRINMLPLNLYVYIADILRETVSRNVDSIESKPIQFYTSWRMQYKVNTVTESSNSPSLYTNSMSLADIYIPKRYFANIALSIISMHSIAKYLYGSLVSIVLNMCWRSAAHSKRNCVMQFKLYDANIDCQTDGRQKHVQKIKFEAGYVHDRSEHNALDCSLVCVVGICQQS